MTDHTSVVSGLAAGVGGAALALLGVDAPTLTAALVGCVLGVAAAKPAGRLHALALFLAAVCASAMLATSLAPLAAAQVGIGDASVWRRVVAIGFGVLLHPLVSAATDAVPTLITSLTRRFGGDATK